MRWRELGSEKGVSDARPGLRASPGTPPPLPRPRHRRGTLPPAISAKGARLSLREDRQGPGEGAGPALNPIELGGFPSEPFRDVRRNDQIGSRPRDAAPGIPISPSRGKTKADPQRKVAAGGVPGVHRPRAGDDATVLPDSRRRDRRDGCEICRVLADLTVDHILPRSLGGPDTPSNRRLLCRRCNSVKGGRIVSDDALQWYRSFERLSRKMGLGLTPPPLGCTGPAPTLNRLAQFASARSKELPG